MTKQEISFYDKSQTDALLAEKANAADLATVATTGSYNDLTDKPTIPAAQVNADWNAVSGVAEILNKPTIPDNAIEFVETTNRSIALTQGTNVLTYMSWNISALELGYEYYMIPNLINPTNEKYMVSFCSTVSTISSAGGTSIGTYIYEFSENASTLYLDCNLTIWRTKHSDATTSRINFFPTNDFSSDRWLQNSKQDKLTLTDNTTYYTIGGL